MGNQNHTVETKRRITLTETHTEGLLGCAMLHVALHATVAKTLRTKTGMVERL